MDSEGTMSLRRGPGRPRRQGSGSPAERRRRSYITPEESPVSSPATNSPVPDLELSQADSPGPSTRSSQRKISSESKMSTESRRDSSESRVSAASEVSDVKSSQEIEETEHPRALSEGKEKPERMAIDEMETEETHGEEDTGRRATYDPICALCCCGEKSLLGQGDLLKFEPTPGFNPSRRSHLKARRTYIDDTLYNPHKRTSLTFKFRRSRSQIKPRERSRSPRRYASAEYTASPIEMNQSAEVFHVGHKEEPEISAVIDASGYSTAHHCCAAWSDNVCQNENFQLLNVDKAIYSGISQRCSYCFRFGATISCAEPGCSRIYHYPCAASSGAFQGIKSLVLLCPEHLELTEDRVDEEELECVICEEPGDLSESLFCTSCGQHYHATCLDPPVATTPIVRAGWQCPNCKICQTCRQPGDDNKMLVCDICDKGYHTFCLNPAMTTIPKNGWKCTNCRRCSDCGTDASAEGLVGKWHHNYTVCDNCYQQRNKGSTFCPICRKTYRHQLSKMKIICDSCQRYVHDDCIDEELLSHLQQMKAAGQSATYHCRDCRGQFSGGLQVETQTVDTDGSTDTKSPGYSRSPRSLTPVQDDSMQSSHDFPLSASSLYEDSISSADTDINSLEEKPEKKEEPLPSSSSFPTFTTGRPSGGGKPLDKMSLLARYAGSKKFSKRRDRERNRERDRSYLGLAKRKPRNSSNRRGPKPKIKSLIPPEGSSQETSEGTVDKMPEKLKDDEDDSPMHTTIVLFPSADTFTFNQDMCVACGSFGQGAEGRLITCSQCGQCYHPYCVSIKITKVVLSKGWRCLDCTVCEGCGKNTDEARLLLCDDCDISYHTYCLDPPLNVVPKGGWKCKWCILYVSCIQCGATTPGLNSEWTSNYTMCGPCGSYSSCPVCRSSYHDDDLICQCTHCERWSHAACDGMFTEEEVEKASSEKAYICEQCRPFFREPTPPPPPLPPPPPPEPEKPPSPVIIKIPVKEPEPVKTKIHELEGVGLTESGFKQITSLALPPMPKKKKLHKSMKSGSLDILKTLADPNSDLSKKSDADLPADAGTDEQIKFDKPQEVTFPTEVIKEKKKRNRCGPKPGIGGFIARQRKPSTKVRSISTDSDELRTSDGTILGEGIEGGDASRHSGKHDKQKRKRRPKTVSELEQKFPTYIQEAFFGKSLLDQGKENSNGTGEENSASSQPSRNPSDKKDKHGADTKTTTPADQKHQITSGQDGDLPAGDDPLNFLPHAEIIDILMKDNFEKTDATNLDIPSVEGEGHPSQPPAPENTDSATQNHNSDQIEELESILTSNLEQMVPEDDLVHMDGKEVEDLLSGVLSPNEQNQQHQASASNSVPASSIGASSGHPAVRVPHHPKALPSLPNIIPVNKCTTQNSDMTSPSFSPDFSEPPSPWPGMSTDDSQGGATTSQDAPSAPPTKDTSSQKWEKDEQLGQLATISAVYFCNINHPRLAEEYPDWSSRLKQIRKMWRNVSPADRQFYLQKARENRAALRIKEAQKVRKISADIQRKRQVDPDGNVSAAQRVNPQHPGIVNSSQGQPQPPLTPGIQGNMGLQGEMVNPGQRIPQVGDRIPQPAMVQTPTGGHPVAPFPMTPGAPSPAQQSIHSGGSTPVHLPDRSPHHSVEAVLTGPHNSLPSGMNGVPLGPAATPTIPTVVDNPLQSPSMAQAPQNNIVPQMGVQHPHMAGNSGSVTPSPVQSPFAQGPPPPFSSSQDNITGMDQFQGPEGSRHLQMQQLKDWLFVRQGRRREQQGWSNEQPRPPPPPYPGNNPTQPMGQFPQGIHAQSGTNFVEPALAAQNSFQVQRPPYVVGGMSPRPMGELASQLQAGQAIPSNQMQKSAQFNTVDPRTGATVVRPGGQGPYIELRHKNMSNPTHQRPRNLGVVPVQQKMAKRPGMQANPNSGDLYEQFLQQETGTMSSNQPGMFRQVSVPPSPMTPNHAPMVPQRRLSLPDGNIQQLSHMMPGARSPGSAPMAAVHQPPVTPADNPPSRPNILPSTSSSNDPVPHPDQEAQLDDLLVEGFNLLDYAVTDVDTNKNSEENQQLFKVFGLGDDQDMSAESSSAADKKKKDGTEHQQLLRELDLGTVNPDVSQETSRAESRKKTVDLAGSDSRPKNAADGQGQSKSPSVKTTDQRQQPKSVATSKDTISEVVSKSGTETGNVEKKSSGEVEMQQPAAVSDVSLTSDASERNNDVPPPAERVPNDSKEDDMTSKSNVKVKSDGKKDKTKETSPEGRVEVKAVEMKIKIEPGEQKPVTCTHQQMEPTASSPAMSTSAGEPSGVIDVAPVTSQGVDKPSESKESSSVSRLVDETSVKVEDTSEGKESSGEVVDDKKPSLLGADGEDRGSAVAESVDATNERDETHAVASSPSVAKTSNSLREAKLSQDKTEETSAAAAEEQGADRMECSPSQDPTQSVPGNAAKIGDDTAKETVPEQGKSPKMEGEAGNRQEDVKVSSGESRDPSAVSSEQISQEKPGAVMSGSSAVTPDMPPAIPPAVTPAPVSTPASAVQPNRGEVPPGPSQRSLLLGEQPLLLQDLLEKEKKEQECQSSKVPLPSEGAVDHAANRERLPFFDLNESDLKQLQEEAKLLVKDNPTMQSTAGNLTSAYYPSSQEAEKVKKPPGPHARLLQVMNQHHLNQQTGSAQNNVQNYGLHFAGDVMPGPFPNEEIAENSPVPGPRGLSQGPRLPAPQHFPVPPQSPMQQGPVGPVAPPVRGLQQNPMAQIGVMPGNGLGGQVRNVVQMPQNPMQQRALGTMIANRMHGPPRMPNGVPRIRPPIMSPNNRMQNPNFPVTDQFQRMPGMSGLPPHMAGFSYSPMGDPSHFQGFDPYDGSEEPAPDKENIDEYQNWLRRRDQIVQMRVKFFEGEVTKERKKKKALTAKKRTCEKNKKVMDEKDVKELEAVTQRHSQFQKHLDSARKQQRQHSILAQEFKMKQQQQQLTNVSSTSPSFLPRMVDNMGIRAPPHMMVQGFPGRRGGAQQMMVPPQMMQLGPGNFPGSQQEMDFSQGMIPMDQRVRMTMNGQTVMGNNQMVHSAQAMAMRHPGSHQIPRMSATPQPTMVQPGQVSPMMAANQSMMPPHHSPLVHASQGNVVLQGQHSPMMPLQSHVVPSHSPMMSPQSPMVHPQSPLMAGQQGGIPGGMQSPLLPQGNSQSVQSPMLPHAPSPLSHVGNLGAHGHQSPMTVPPAQQSPLSQRSPVMMQPGYVSPHHQMMMNHNKQAENQKATPFRVPAGQQSPIKSRTGNVVLPGHRSPMFQPPSSPLVPSGHQSPMVALSPSAVASQAQSVPKSSSSMMLVDQQSPIFSHSPSPMAASHQSPQTPGQKSPMHPPSMSPLVQNGHQSPIQNSPGVAPNQGQQSPVRHPASPAVKDNQMSPLVQHQQMMAAQGHFTLNQIDGTKMDQTAVMDTGRQTPLGMHPNMVNPPPHIAVGVDNHPFSDGFEQRERLEKLKMLQDHQKQQHLSKEAIVQKIQQQGLARHGLSQEIAHQMELQMQQQQQQAQNMTMQQLIQSGHHRRDQIQAAAMGSMQFFNSAENQQVPMPVVSEGPVAAEKALTVPPSYPPEKPAKKPKKKKSKKEKDREKQQQQQQLANSQQDFSLPATALLSGVPGFDQHMNVPVSAATDPSSLQLHGAMLEAMENGDLARAKHNLLLKQLLRGPPVCAAGTHQTGHPVLQQQSGTDGVITTTPSMQPGLSTITPQNTEPNVQPPQPLQVAAATPTSTSKPVIIMTADRGVLNDDDANIKLTPEQQKQLEMVEKQPYVKKNGKPVENDHQLLMEIHKKGKYSSNSKKSKDKDADSHKKKHKEKKKKKRKKGEDKKTPSLEDLMTSLKALPILQLSEPVIESSLTVFPLFGTPANGGHRLKGSYGQAILEGVADFYGAFVNGPFGRKELMNGPSTLTEDEKKKMSKKGVQALTVKSSEVTVMTGDEIMQEMQSHQRTITRTINHAYTGRGNHSSPLFALSAAPAQDDISSLRGVRTPGSRSTTPGEIAPSSSPELDEGEPLETAKMRGLRLITRNASEMALMARADSPNIPIVRPTPRKAKPVREMGNSMNVTLTLGSAVNKNIKELLGSISKLLRVMEPTTYEVTRGTGEKEYFGVKDPVEVPKIDLPPVTSPPVTAMDVDTKPATPPKPETVSGARFCKLCDVMIVGEGIHKVTGPSADSSHTFCSTNCYMQYTISQRTQLQQSKDTVTKIVDCQNNEGSNMTPPPNVNVPLSGSLPTSPLPPALSPRTPSKASPVSATVPSPKAASVPQPVPEGVSQPPVKVVIPRLELKDVQKEAEKDGCVKTAKSGFRRKSGATDENAPQCKKIKMKRWKKWNMTLSPSKKQKPPEEEDIDELMRKLGTSLQPGSSLEDTRVCILCGGIGDGDTDGTARLLNVDVGIWVHLNCALWSDNVYETLNGALMNVLNCVKQGKTCKCCYCCKAGATVSCHKLRCYNVYHFGCAIQDHCMFFKDKTMLCPLHAPSKPTENTLDSHVVFRRVYVSRDEHRQVASIMQQTARTHTLRVGSLIFHSLGQLLPHQMQTFHSSTAIFPIGYETVRLYWSMRFTNKRCQYFCSVHENDEGSPYFAIKVVEQGHEDLLLQDRTPKAVWDQVLEHIAKLRQEADMINLFPYYLTGEDLFGFTEPAIQRVLESLPGIEMIKNYSFRYGRSPFIDLPLAVNPTGCARTEPKRQARFRPHHLLTSTIPSRSKSCLSEGDYGPLYNKLFVHTKSSQYKKLKTDWKQYVYLAKSNIQGLGMFAACDIEKHTMVIEYVGTLIRNETSNLREKNYNAANRGIYMFRIDNDTVCDATISGNAARYINHSCDPNCVAEVVTFGPDTKKIIIFSNRKLVKGEELTYDYKFDIEDDRQKKIPCTCKAPNCRKWMN